MAPVNLPPISRSPIGGFMASHYGPPAPPPAAAPNDPHAAIQAFLSRNPIQQALHGYRDQRLHGLAQDYQQDHAENSPLQQIYAQREQSLARRLGSNHTPQIHGFGPGGHVTGVGAGGAQPGGEREALLERLRQMISGPGALPPHGGSMASSLPASHQQNPLAALLAALGGGGGSSMIAE